jgi:dolichol-phosphate mannosyltransferase
VSELKNRICLVIPVYNESPSIANSVKEFMSGGSHYTLLVVNDGSSDGTYELLNSCAEDLRFELITHKHNHGYGAACKTGARWAYEMGYEWVIFADSDLTNPVSEIISLARSLDSDSVDVYKANRFGNTYGMKKVEGYRRILSHTAFFIASTFIGKSISDPTNGFRAVRTSVFAEFILDSKDFSIILEEVTEYFRLKLRIQNFESILGSRNETQNLSNFSYSSNLLFRYFRWTLKCAFFRFKRFIWHY